MKAVLVRNDKDKIKKNLDALKKLTKYDKILTKGNNLFVKFEDGKIIPLIWTKSIFKMCKMATANPAEIVTFAHYIIEPSESENMSVSVSASASVSVSVSEREQREEEKERGKSKFSPKPKIQIPKILKQGIIDDLKKKGNFIAKNPVLFKKIWMNIYKYLLIFPLIIFIGIIVSLVSYKVKFLSFVEILNYILTILLSTTAYIGIGKFKRKSLQEWKEVNIMIYIMEGITLITFLTSLFPSLGGSIAIFVYAYRFYIFLFYLILGSILGCCYYLNKEMNLFFTKYYELEQEGKLLTEVNE